MTRMESLKHQLAYAPHIADRRYGKASVVLGVGSIAAAIFAPYPMVIMVHLLYSGAFMLVVGTWIWWADNYQRRIESSGTSEVEDESLADVYEEWQCPECDEWNFLYQVDEETAFCSHCGEDVSKDADVKTRPR